VIANGAGFPQRGLASQAQNGDANCSSMTCAPIAEPEKDSAWDGTDFFDEEDNEDRSNEP
jgi:hypothetical protein